MRLCELERFDANRRCTQPATTKVITHDQDGSAGGVYRVCEEHAIELLAAQPKDVPVAIVAPLPKDPPLKTATVAGADADATGDIG